MEGRAGEEGRAASRCLLTFLTSTRTLPIWNSRKHHRAPQHFRFRFCFLSSQAWPAAIGNLSTQLDPKGGIAASRVSVKQQSTGHNQTEQFPTHHPGDHRGKDPFWSGHRWQSQRDLIFHAPSTVCISIIHTHGQVGAFPFASAPRAIHISASSPPLPFLPKCKYATKFLSTDRKSTRLNSSHWE